MRLVWVMLAAALVGASAQPADRLSAMMRASLCSSGAAVSAEGQEYRAQRVAGFGAGALAIEANAEAQAWFDYGLQNAWAFNHHGAVEAFKQAQALDPSCAMCVWGEAWAGGPTLNFGIDEAHAATLLARVEAAEALAASESDTNRALIAALRQRYSGAGRRRGGDFADAVVALAERSPGNDTLQVLAADAEMVAGRAPSQVMARLEPVLARAPEHTGAIHFYIHAAEWAGEDAKAEPYANRLAALAPSASHLIHMPSHTFYRLGRYREAGQTNLDAVRADQRYLQTIGVQTPLPDIPYHDHNIHFGMGGALMAGDAEVALALARHYEANWPPPPEAPNFHEVLRAAAWIARAREGDPQAVLDAAAPRGGPFMQAMWRYARGEAYARQGDAGAIAREAEAITLQVRAFRVYGDQSTNALRLARIARDVLTGRAAMLSADYAAAERAFLRAARLQERSFPGGDPPLFWYPVRRSAALALLQQGRAAEAAAEARRVLESWPQDPLTLRVLARAERVLGDVESADAHEAAARAGWAGEWSAVDDRLI